MSERGNTTLFAEQTLGAACEVPAFCLLDIFIIKFAFVYCFVPNPMKLTDRANQSAVKSELLRWRCIYISGKNAFYDRFIPRLMFSVFISRRVSIRRHKHVIPLTLFVFYFEHIDFPIAP